TKFILPLPGKIVSVVAGNARDLSAGDPTHQIKLGMKDVMVMREQDGSFAALDLKCTHAGCIVHWQPNQKIFKCPCHGGEYDATGKVIKGPPPRPLNRLQVAVNNHGDITVTDLPAANV
ncbi:MAG TPA: Rieske (2Fe-2S) protein, partial [Candidatus Kapabacteria bacterium]|nr:Rieske (2Fe-2S) protein [Candidatus Kapabacteria bacterium]